MQPESIPATLRKTLLTSNLFGEGERLGFRVLKSLPSNQYLIQVKQQQVSVQSRLPLEVGKTYMAEVTSKGGQIQLICKPLVKGLIESLFSQKQACSSFHGAA